MARTQSFMVDFGLVLALAFGTACTESANGDAPSANGGAGGQGTIGANAGGTTASNAGAVGGAVSGDGRGGGGGAMAGGGGGAGGSSPGGPMAGAGGAGGSGGASPGTSPDAAAVDVIPSPDAAGAGARPKVVLLLTRSAGGYRHDSIETAAAAIQTALMPLGITSEISADLTLFTATGLARFGAVVLVSSSGSVLGTVDSPEVAAFLAYVRGGGGVVGIHAATALAYAGTSAYVQMLGGKFIDHPGGIRTTNCYTEGTHPAIAALPAMFPMRDEIYTYSNQRMDSQVVVRCDPLGAGEKIPLAWHHKEGEGRVFSTGFGHGKELWTADGQLLKGHVVPAILWTLGL